MHPKLRYRFFFFLAAWLLAGCTASNIIRYYSTNQTQLDHIERQFKKAYARKPFSIEFTDRRFDRVSLELKTDSLTYIYEFFVGDTRMEDTLRKYGFDEADILHLIGQMREASCIWINSLDYYNGTEQKFMVYISLWRRGVDLPFLNKKYYILTYFPEPQSFDDRGNLLAGRRRKRIRKINTDVFKRISDTVCYSMSDHFR